MIDELARESRNSIFLLRLASEANLAINAEWSEFLTRRAFEFDPNNPEVVLKLAGSFARSSAMKRRSSCSCGTSPWCPVTIRRSAHIGSCLSAMGRFGEAESYFRQALKGLDDPVTHFNMGLLLALTNRLDEAMSRV